MAAWRMPEAEVAPLRRELRQIEEWAGCFEVHRDNWRAVCFFISLGTQWKMAIGLGAAAYTGLDYAGVEAAMRMSGMAGAARRRLFADVRTMEAAALDELNRGLRERKHGA